MDLVGLTGGIGAGKSTAAELLRSRGALIIDADRIARDVVAPGEPALAEIVERFGAQVLGPDGGLDRAAVAAMVFDDAEARRALEVITHPHVRARIDARLAAIRRQEQADGVPRLVVVEHPLLVESGAATGYPTVIVVAAPVEVRVRRLVAQRGMSEHDAWARIRAQADDATREAAATHVVDNRGSPAELAVAVDAIHRRLTTRA